MKLNNQKELVVSIDSTLLEKKDVLQATFLVVTIIYSLGKFSPSYSQQNIAEDDSLLSRQRLN